MLKMISKSWKTAFAAAFAIAVAIGSPAQAVLLAPGGGPLPIGGAPTLNFPPLPLASLSSPYGLPGGFTGFLNTYVIDEGAANLLGGYTFFYGVDNDINTNPAILQEINFVQFNGFAPLLPVDADYSTTPPLSGGLAFPTDVDSTITGDTIAFFYNNPADPIQSGEASAWMFVRTASRTINFNTAQLIGAGSASAAILAPIPEPTTVLFGVALIGAVGLGRRRRS